jgi:hypothetical protein
MSGEAAARVLHDQFEAIRRAEMARLHRKLSALSAQEQHTVDAITAQVVQAIVRHPAAALTQNGSSPALAQAAFDLFKVR